MARPPGHAQIAAQAATHRAETYQDHEDTILDVARTLPVAGFRQVIAYWTAIADDAAAVKTLIDRLDALEPPDPTDGPHPPRTLAQRRAAALMRMVHGETPPATTLTNLELRCRQHHLAVHRRHEHDIRQRRE